MTVSETHTEHGELCSISHVLLFDKEVTFCAFLSTFMPDEILLGSFFMFTCNLSLWPLTFCSLLV